LRASYNKFGERGASNMQLVVSCERGVPDGRLSSLVEKEGKKKVLKLRKEGRDEGGEKGSAKEAGKERRRGKDKKGIEARAWKSRGETQDVRTNAHP